MIFRVSASILFLVLLPAGAQTPVVDARLPATSDATLRSILTGMAFDFTKTPPATQLPSRFPLTGTLSWCSTKSKV